MNNSAMVEFLCVTLWQPWAAWIASGLKTIETRTHARFASLAGKTICIHAGKRYDRDAVDVACAVRPDVGGVWLPWMTLRGYVVCTARVAEHRRLGADDSYAALCDCSGGDRYGLVLEDVKPLVFPYEAAGKQGIWKVEVPEWCLGGRDGVSCG